MSKNESQLTNEIVHVTESDQKDKEFPWEGTYERTGKKDPTEFD